MKNFEMVAIVAKMRTGSNLLERLLGQHPELSIFGELFNYNFIGRPNWQQLDRFTVEVRASEHDSFIEYIKKRVFPNIPVFRIFQDHDFFALDRVLRDQKIAKIILKRDPAQTYASLLRAEKSGQWHVPRGEDPIQVDISIDASQAAEYAKTHREFYHQVESFMR